mmetsp:Transcript_22373/g.43539  ORF Transcript_22373/g.43539 Transcript_22373/m.43539 type:complete len:87 (+) Transcript_22373:1639-1899(+)
MQGMEGSLASLQGIGKVETEVMVRIASHVGRDSQEIPVMGTRDLIKGKIEEGGETTSYAIHEIERTRAAEGDQAVQRMRTNPEVRN